MNLKKTKNHFLWLLSTLVFSSPLTYAFITHALKPVEIELRGEFIITFNNCGCPEHEATGPDLLYFLHDHKNNKTIELVIGPEQAKKIKIDKPVTLSGNFIERKDRVHQGTNSKPFKASKISYDVASPDELGEEGIDKEDVTKNEPLQDGPGAAGPVTKDLQCLIIHANTKDNPVNPGKITNMENMVFNAPDNISKAMLAATYGHYRLTHGNVKSITVNLPNTVASDNYYRTMSNLMVGALPAAFSAIGETFKASDYDRYLFCTPRGTLGIPSAWGSYGGTPRPTFYSYGWTGSTFDGILHEMGHNFGFRHSGHGSNEYADKTCVMGVSHLGRGNNTSTYGAVKKLQAGWFAPYPEAETTISGDATFDLHPISINPEDTPGMRVVKVADSDHYISYRRNLPPYAWLRDNADRNKVYVHRYTASWQPSWRERGFSSGSYKAGNTQVILERYGPNREYVTVSFDMDDGNAKPLANAQSVTASTSMFKNITLSGSDRDNDAITYKLVTQPSNGTLTGMAPNLTYVSNNNYVGSDSFVFKVSDSKISSFATVNITIRNAYNDWASGGGTGTGTNGGFYDDPNVDGIVNGMAWVLGADDPSADLADLLPTAEADSDVNYLVFTFLRSDTAHAVLGDKIIPQYCGDLKNWKTAVDGENGVIITSVDHAQDSSLDKVTVKVPIALGNNGALFMRLNVTE